MADQSIIEELAEIKSQLQAAKRINEVLLDQNERLLGVIRNQKIEMKALQRQIDLNNGKELDATNRIASIEQGSVLSDNSFLEKNVFERNIFETPSVLAVRIKSTEKTSSKLKFLKSIIVF
jgi:hypothetical protein